MLNRPFLGTLNCGALDGPFPLVRLASAEARSRRRPPVARRPQARTRCGPTTLPREGRTVPPDGNGDQDARAVVRGLDLRLALDGFPGPARPRRPAASSAKKQADSTARWTGPRLPARPGRQPGRLPGRSARSRRQDGPGIDDPPEPAGKLEHEFLPWPIMSDGRVDVRKTGPLPACGWPDRCQRTDGKSEAGTGRGRSGRGRAQPD